MVVVTIVMSVNIFTRMLKSEEEVCWQRLEIATSSTARKIEVRMKDNLSILKTVGDAYILTEELNDLKSVGEYLSSVISQTLFDRIDIILPDERIITQDGIIASRGGESTFETLAKNGTHITGRVTSSFTGEEVICCVSPIITDNEVVGLLVGTINCSTLNDTFNVFTYGEEAQLFLIDRTDGEYILDNWHGFFGNIHELGLRKKAHSDEMIDMAPFILSGEPARLAFISETNGEPSYQYSMAVDGFNWTICVAVQEDVAFANLNNLKNDLLQAGFVGFLVIVVYVLWNIILNMTAVRSEEKLKKLEYERAKNAARATFISNMSHDIRTPLNGIVGMVQIVKNHHDDKALVEDCLEKIEISAQYLSTLTGDMLDISEIERDKLVMPEEPVNLHRLADELTSMMEKQARDSGVSYHIELSKLKNPRIIGSSVHIKRILVNLIGNAIKYSKNAGRKVWVTISDERLSVKMTSTCIGLW